MWLSGLAHLHGHRHALAGDITEPLGPGDERDVVPVVLHDVSTARDWKFISSSTPKPKQSVHYPRHGMPWLAFRRLLLTRAYCATCSADPGSMTVARCRDQSFGKQPDKHSITLYRSNA
jgi:hypothetical protein